MNAHSRSVAPTRCNTIGGRAHTARKQFSSLESGSLRRVPMHGLCDGASVSALFALCVAGHPKVFLDSGSSDDPPLRATPSRLTLTQTLRSLVPVWSVRRCARSSGAGGGKRRLRGLKRGFFARIDQKTPTLRRHPTPISQDPASPSWVGFAPGEASNFLVHRSLRRDALEREGRKT